MQIYQRSAIHIIFLSICYVNYMYCTVILYNKMAVFTNSKLK